MLLIAHGAVIDVGSEEAIKILMRSIAGESFVDLQTEVKPFPQLKLTTINY